METDVEYSDKEIKELFKKLYEEIMVQRRQIVLKGLLNLNGFKLPTLMRLGVQPKLRVLDLSNCEIDSFETLPTQPALMKIIANNSGISKYTGLSRQPKLSHLSLINTPISQREYFRLEASIVVGNHLSVLNGSALTSNEKRESNKYPIIAQILLELDWSLEYPLPDIDRFRGLAKDRHIMIKGADSGYLNDVASKYFRPPPSLFHNNTVIHSSISEQSEKDAKDRELILSIISELEKINVYIPQDEYMEQNVVKAVEKLADVIKSLEPISEKLIEIQDENIDD